MDLKKYFHSLDIEEINRFIEDGQEENLHLEFKTVNHPSYNQNNREYDKINISKVISGFANSSGGIVVWGIKAKENKNRQDIASEIKPINELTKFLNTLNRLEGQATTPVIIGIEHKKIETSNDCGLVISYIPASEFAPHMANYSDKHYYKRSGDSFYICEHYDIKDMFHRKKSAYLNLKIKNKIVSHRSRNRIRYEMTMSLFNNGRNFARAPLIKVEICSPYEFSEFGLDGNGNVGVFKHKATPRNIRLSTYMGGQDIIIFPDLEYDIDKIILEVDEETTELPNLVVKYMIVAENMEKTNFEQDLTIRK